jgi:hypothetical protein
MFTDLIKGFFTITLGLLLSSFASLGQSRGSRPNDVLPPTGKSPVEKYLDRKTWNDLFPNRYGKGNNKMKTGDFYSFDSFVASARAFPLFLKEGDDTTARRELAAFLANIAQETSGGWDDAPGGYYKWGLYYLEEQSLNSTGSDYADTSKKDWPPVKGKSYHGRGPKQLSWNYNYGQFSQAWFGSKDSLLRHPELLVQDPVISFASAIWFWMTPQFPKPSCHDIMTGKWQPTESDIQKGRLPGFGSTVNVINGGIECGNKTTLDKTRHRYDYYLYFCKILKVEPGLNTSCADAVPFGR